MAAKYRAQFDGIGKQGESTKTGGGTKNEFGSGRSKGHGDGAAKSWQRDGDWLCPNTGCGNVNFAFRGVCNHCEAARPADVSGTSAGNGGRGCGMRPGGRVNTTSAVKKVFQTVKVEMSVDDWKKWCQFKRMYIEDKKSTEASNAFISAASTNSGGNTYHTMSYYKMMDTPWLIDSGASRHMAGTHENFVDYAPDSKRQSVRLADGSFQTVLGSGTIMLGCKPAATPIEQNHRTLADSGDPVDKYQYQRLVGRLIYLSHTRPDIAYAVSVVSRYMHDPRSGHLEVVNRILRYLKGCPGKGILFSNHGHLKVEGYTDADWAGCLDDRRSTSGYCVFVGDNLVCWRSKKQNVVARSTAEAEFRSMASGLCELMWLRILLSELGLFDGGPLQLYCDNQAAINIVHNPVQHDRTKHVEIDRHFIREKLDERSLRVTFVRSNGQLADVLTKGVSVVSFVNLCSKMGLMDIFAPS